MDPKDDICNSCCRLRQNKLLFFVWVPSPEKLLDEIVRQARLPVDQSLLRFIVSVLVRLWKKRVLVATVTRWVERQLSIAKFESESRHCFEANIGNHFHCNDTAY